MNVYAALLLFSFLILIYWIITELFTFFFRLTGLPVEKARFQVISLINVFLSMSDAQVGHQLLGLLIPLGTVALIFACMRVPAIHAWGENMLRRLADRAFDRKEAFNAVLLVDYIGSDSIAQVTLRHIPGEYIGKTLSETQLRADTGILVMLVERNGSKPMPAHADTVFEIGDKLTVFGNYKIICKSFHAREHFADD